MIVLNVDNLSLSFGTKVILEHVTFSLDEGEVETIAHTTAIFGFMLAGLVIQDIIK